MSEPDEVAPDALRLRAHGKLTVSLTVVGRRSDGYHDLDAVMVSLADVYDRVEVSLTGTGDFTFQAAGALAAVPLDGENLVVRAVRKLLERVEPGAGARIRLAKHIPAGTGLGGGSADAAAGLVAVAHLRPEETRGVDLGALGAEIGSDVPFCLAGGAARVTGRGERVEPLPPSEGWWAVVAVPPVRVPTAAVYQAWDELGAPRSERIAEPVAGLAELAPGGMRNDLEPAALAVCPELGEFRDRVAEVTGLEPLLAGSGSSYVVVVDEERAARRLAGAIARGVPQVMSRHGLVAVTTPGPRGVTVLGAPR